MTNGSVQCDCELCVCIISADNYHQLSDIPANSIHSNVPVHSSDLDNGIQSVH